MQRKGGVHREFPENHREKVDQSTHTVRVTHNLDPGHPDQGAGEGTLGAYGCMYPTLPSCGQDGEYIFPMEQMSPSGGSQEERPSILQDNSL